jgi:hypothetical protein
VQRSATECGVCECDHEAPIMRRPWPTGGCCDIAGVQNMKPSSHNCLVLLSLPGPQLHIHPLALFCLTITVRLFFWMRETKFYTHKNSSHHTQCWYVIELRLHISCIEKLLLCLLSFTQHILYMTYSCYVRQLAKFYWAHSVYDLQLLCTSTC